MVKVKVKVKSYEVEQDTLDIINTVSQTKATKEVLIKVDGKYGDIKNILDKLQCKYLNKLRISDVFRVEEIHSFLDYLSKYVDNLDRVVDINKVGKINELCILGSIGGRVEGSYFGGKDKINLRLPNTKPSDKNRWLSVIMTLNHEYGHMIDNKQNKFDSEESKNFYNKIQKEFDNTETINRIKGVKSNFSVGETSIYYSVDQYKKVYVTRTYLNYLLTTIEVIARAFDKYLTVRVCGLYDDEIKCNTLLEDYIGFNYNEIEGIIEKYFKDYLIKG